jgi:hypothetical protein
MTAHIVLRLTRSQQMALVDILIDYVRQPDSIQTLIDVQNDTETTVGELLSLVASTREIELVAQ